MSRIFIFDTIKKEANGMMDMQQLQAELEEKTLSRYAFRTADTAGRESIRVKPRSFAPNFNATEIASYTVSLFAV